MQMAPHSVHGRAKEGACLIALQARPVEQAYSMLVFEDLWGRCEEPDARNRWDQPLFQVSSADAASRDATLQVHLMAGSAASTGILSPSKQQPGWARASQS